MKFFKLPLLVMLLSLTASGYAQDATGNSNWKFHKGGNWYFSWGYSKYFYTKCDIHFKENIPGDASTQAATTEYTLKDVKSHDRLGLEKLYNVPLTVPQFNVRIGYFFNEKQDLGIELTYDHAKFITADRQFVRMVGTTNGVPFDSTAYLYPDTDPGSKPFVYKLNNGANFFELNLVKKFHLYDSPHGKIHFSYIAKAGAGWNTPHVENTIFGEKNKPHFQPIGGWNVGVESALRCVFYNYAYLEFGQKGVFASYYKLRNAQGTSAQHFGAYEIVLSLGVNIPGKMNRTYTTNAH